MTLLGRMATLALAVAFGCLVTSRSASAQPASADQSVDLRSEVLGPGDIDGMLLERDGTSASVITDSSSYWQEIRNQVIVGSWERAFIAPDFASGVIIEAVEFRNAKAAVAVMRPTGLPDDNPPPLPAGATPRIEEVRAGYVNRSALFFVGRLGARVEVYASGDDAEQQSRALLSDVVARQRDRLPSRADLSDGTVSLRRLHLLLTLGEIVAILWLQLAVGLATLLGDRSARQRLRARGRLGRRTRESDGVPAVDVDGEARDLLRRHWRRALRRNGVALAAIVISSVLHLNLWQTAFCLVLALLVLSAFERRKHVKATVAPSFQGWVLIPGVVLIGLGMALVGVGVLLLWMALVADLFGSSGASPELVESFRRVTTFFGIVLLLVSPAPLSIARRLAARRVARTTDTSQPRTLLLRSFADDRLRIRSRGAAVSGLLDRLTLRRWERFEEILLRPLATSGPVYALAEPGRLLPPLGALRASAPSTDWETRIRRMIDAAPLVVVCLARSAYVRWEVLELRDRGALGRTIFVLPPITELDRRRRLHAFADILGLDVRSVDLEGPGRRVLAVVLPQPTEPVVVVSVAHDDVSYEAALSAAQAILAGEGPVLAPARASAPDMGSARSLSWNGPMIYPPHGGPRKRRWFLRPWGLVSLLFVLTSILRIAVTAAPPKPDHYTVIDTDRNVQALVRDPATDAVYAILQGGQVLALDLAGATSRPVGNVGGTVSDAAVVDGQMVTSSAVRDEVVGLDLRTGTSWQRSVPEAPRGVALSRGRALVALAGSDEIIELDVDTGVERGRASIGPAPWDIAVLDGRVVVSLAGGEDLVDLDPSSLREVGRISVGRSPRQIVAAAGGVWVHSAPDGVVAIDHMLRRGQRVSLTESASSSPLAPAVSFSDSFSFAIHVRDKPAHQIALLAADRGRPVCTRTGMGTPIALATTASGKLVVAYAEFRDLVILDVCR